MTFIIEIPLVSCYKVITLINFIDLLNVNCSWKNWYNDGQNNQQNFEIHCDFCFLFFFKLTNEIETFCFVLFWTKWEQDIDCVCDKEWTVFKKKQIKER